MPSSSVGIAVADPALQREWVRLLACAGFRSAVLALEHLPPPLVSVLVVVLDLRHPPVPYGFWLGRVSQPVLLITPHITAAQTLCPHVPRLAAIVDPVQAVLHLSDVLAMVQHMTAGTLVLPAPSAPIRRWPWQGAAA